jgi:hypothetical protein
MSPRAEDSHQVGGEFLKDHFDLLMHWFPLDACEGRVRHLGLYTVGRDSIRHRAWLGCVGEGAQSLREEF